MVWPHQLGAASPVLAVFVFVHELIAHLYEESPDEACWLPQPTGPAQTNAAPMMAAQTTDNSRFMRPSFENRMTWR
jgi:hypothetical protein